VPERRARSRPPSTRAKARDGDGGHGPTPAAGDRDERNERFTLIEFVWDIPSGIQPVILVERKLLH
jgi:hypothetical protein